MRKGTTQSDRVVPFYASDKLAAASGGDGG